MPIGKKYAKIKKIISINYNIMLGNSLDSKVFQDELDFKTLENILETLDHVTPKKVARSEFDALKWNFLVETGEDRFGKQYDLFLPEDLVHWELLHLIDFLSQKFWIENYTPYGRLVTQTKVMIGVVLRWMWEENWEKYLHELAQKYSLSPEFIQRLQSQKDWWDKISFSEAKEMIKSIKSKREEDNDEKVWENEEDIVLWLEELKELFWEEFDLTFFRKWINMLRLGMMTITQAEQSSKIQYCLENWFKKEDTSPWLITFTKWEYRVTINIETNDLHKEEQLLRDNLSIEEYKNKLNYARKVWNKDNIERLELEASKCILKNLRNYSYHLNHNHYWFQLNRIAKNKELFCSWFSCLAHSFLQELGILHNWLNIDKHSALELIIWDKRYYFDPSNLKELYEFEYLQTNWNFKEIKLLWCNFPVQYWYSFDVEKSLLSHILINKSQIVKDSWLEIKILNKAKQLNPKYAWIYINLWNIYSNLWFYNEAIKYYNASLEKFFSWIPIINIGNQYYHSWDIWTSLNYYKQALPHIKYPYLWEIYENISELYKLNWDNKKSVLCKFASELISWKNPILDWEYLEEKEVIKELVSFKIWIHSYLWDN